MRKIFIILATALLGVLSLTTTSCSKDEAAPTGEGLTTPELQLKGDHTIYGLACEGCNDSTIYLLPNDGSDPIAYDIIDAFHKHLVLGDIKTGDWIGVVRNEKDTTVADRVIDLDQLKGSWCYIVMPKMRDWESMSKKQQSRMQKDMPDSVKEQYLIPREYGFTLQRQFKASSIGRVMVSESVENESPVVYPQMSEYLEWHILNGLLILTRVDDDAPQKANPKGDMQKSKERPTVTDTINIDFLSDDSLVLSSDGISRSYYRISSAAEANKLAREKAEKLAKQAMQEVTGGSSTTVDAVLKEDDQNPKPQE